MKGVKYSCKSSAVEGTDDVLLWMTMKRVRQLGGSVRELKALTVKMETVTLIVNGRQNVT
jgi:hypothetical protein